MKLTPRELQVLRCGYGPALHTTISFNGSYCLGANSSTDGRKVRPNQYWENGLCFAVWKSIPNTEYLRTLRYKHNIRRLTYDNPSVERLYKNGYEQVIQKCFPLLPSYERLMVHDWFSMRIDQIPMLEVNVQMRMLRSFHEHQELLRSCGWVYQHARKGTDPVVMLTLASCVEVGRLGLTGEFIGDSGHHALGSQGLLLKALRIFRLLDWIQQSQGRIFVNELHRQSSPFDRTLYGANQLLLASDGVFPVIAAPRTVNDSSMFDTNPTQGGVSRILQHLHALSVLRPKLARVKPHKKFLLPKSFTPQRALPEEIRPW